MILADLVAGDEVFIDASIFAYQFAPDPKYGAACNQFLQRVDNRELRGIASIHILSEMAHRLMTIEASTSLGWPQMGISNRLRRHPAEVQKLTAYRLALDKIANSSIQILTISFHDILAIPSVCQQSGLLSNDALTVALMRSHGLTRLASEDADFDRVPGITMHRLNFRPQH